METFGSEPPGGTTAPRILLADDDETMREYVQKLLESHGMHVLTAEDGHRALARARDSTADPVARGASHATPRRRRRGDPGVRLAFADVTTSAPRTPR